MLSSKLTKEKKFIVEFLGNPTIRKLQLLNSTSYYIEDANLAIFKFVPPHYMQEGFSGLMFWERFVWDDVKYLRGDPIQFTKVDSATISSDYVFSEESQFFIFGFLTEAFGNDEIMTVWIYCQENSELYQISFQLLLRAVASTVSVSLGDEKRTIALEIFKNTVDVKFEAKFVGFLRKGLSKYYYFLILEPDNKLLKFPMTLIDSFI